jgi:hypothetical protein
MRRDDKHRRITTATHKRVNRVHNCFIAFGQIAKDVVMIEGDTVPGV